MFSGWLTILVFLPLAGAIVIALFVRGDRNVRWFAGIVSLTELILSIVVFAKYDTAAGADQFQLVDKISNWIPVESFNVQYF
ncbi:MAG: hypothetical protein IIB17_08685, partial [Chloroflexi bacterium]|nr:hypothetical protein [Chloroflexota bacterium]